MIYFFPYSQFTIKTNKSKELIIDRFYNNVIVVQSFSYYKWTNLNDFEGIILEDGFKLKRNIKLGYSSFLPILYCKFDSSKDELKLRVKIRFNNVISILSILSLLFLIIISTNDLKSLIFALFIYIILIFFFNLEVKSVIEKAKEIFDK